MGRAKKAPAEAPGDQLRAYAEDGSVRPADERFLTDDQIAARDLHIEESQSEIDKATDEILRNTGSSAVVAAPKEDA